MNTFLISVQDVKDNSYLDNNIDDKTIKTAILNCQEQMIEPTIGSDLYDKLIAGISNGNLALSYQNLIVQKLWKPLIHGTLYMVARNLLFRYTNDSIVSSSNENSTAISVTDMLTLKNEEEINFQHHIKKLKLYLDDNSSTYPEYYTVSADGLAAQRNENAINFFYDGEDIV